MEQPEIKKVIYIDNDGEREVSFSQGYINSSLDLDYYGEAYMVQSGDKLLIISPTQVRKVARDA